MKKLFLLFFVSCMAVSAMAWDALYIVGGGVKQAGWDDERVPMVKISETEFEYSGYFYKTNIGEGGTGEGWKIVSSPSTWNDETHGWDVSWDCTQYRPMNGWAKCGRGAEVMMKSDGGDDNKFYVDEAGFYTINIKTDVNKVTISQSDKPKRLYPVGGGCEVGWDSHSNVCLTETSEGSGKYTGTLTLRNTDANHELKFLCQPLYTAFVGPKVDANGDHDINGVGVFDGESYVESIDGDHKFWILDQAAGTYNITYDWNTGKLYIVPTEITVKAAISQEAVAALGTVKCFAWTGVGSETKEMALTDGFYTATFAPHMPMSFLIYNGKFNDEVGGVQSVDMSNDGNGYTADKCVNLISHRTGDNKLKCFHNDDCSLNTHKFTVNVYVEDAGWEDVYFYTQNAGENTEYNNVFTHAVKGEDNWYSYTFEGVESVKWVATATTENWNTQVGDIEVVNADKYIYVSAENKEIYEGKWVNKIVSLTSKDQKKELTFEFKFDGAAHTSWGDANPVGLFYWQNYAFDGEEAADHASTIQMTADANGVYSAAITAFNNVKFVVQSDIANGYHGNGHYTVQHDAAEEATGFSESKKFWLKDEGAGHFVALTENFDFTPAEMTITLNKDGFASFYWDKNYALTGADAYTAKVEGDAVVLTKVNGNGIIPARSAVILYGTCAGEATATETLDAATGYDYENALHGMLEAATPSGNYYVLAEYGEPAVTCFVGVSGMEVPAYRAYLPVESVNAPLRIRFATETATGLDENENVNVNKVMQNGQIYIIRGEKKFNVLGMICE